MPDDPELRDAYGAERGRYFGINQLDRTETNLGRFRAQDRDRYIGNIHIGNNAPRWLKAKYPGSTEGESHFVRYDIDGHPRRLADHYGLTPGSPFSDIRG